MSQRHAASGHFQLRPGQQPRSPAEQITSVDLPADGLDLEAYLEEIRRQLMRDALDRSRGVQTQAAELLGISFRSFRYYAKKMGLTGSPTEDEEPEARLAAG